MRAKSLFATALAAALTVIPAAGQDAAGCVEFCSIDGQSVQAGRWIEESPRDLSDFRFTDAAGHSLSLSDFRGRIVVLSLWASWCPPCRAELPALDRLQAALDGNPISVIALSVDQKDMVGIDRVYDRLGVRHLAKYADGAEGSSRSIGAVGLPTAIILDGRGREIGRVEGDPQWDAARIVEKLRALANIMS
jgi:thiol-disulfide isomerase/thioredoxin